MKQLISCLLLMLIALTANAQYDSTLNENFNTSCASSTGFPIDWISYNPLYFTIPDGEWQCTSYGRDGSPGMLCSGIWGSPGSYYLDTSYLITPGLDLSDDTGQIYLQFDTKTTNIVLGGRLAMVASVDSNFPQAETFSLDSTLSPVFTEGDSSGWVTHQVDLTPYRGYVPLYIAFLYTSGNTSGGVWFLDNVKINPWPLGVPNVTKYTLPLTVIGNSSSSQIKLAYEAPIAGTYQIELYDMLGHKVYEEQVNASMGKSTYTISGLQLPGGMYLLKMGNDLVYATTKTIVQ